MPKKRGLHIVFQRDDPKYDIVPLMDWTNKFLKEKKINSKLETELKLEEMPSIKMTHELSKIMLSQKGKEYLEQAILREKLAYIKQSLEKEGLTIISPHLLGKKECNYLIKIVEKVDPFNKEDCFTNIYDRNEKHFNLPHELFIQNDNASKMIENMKEYFELLYQSVYQGETITS